MLGQVLTQLQHLWHANHTHCLGRILKSTPDILTIKHLNLLNGLFLVGGTGMYMYIHVHLKITVQESHSNHR